MKDALSAALFHFLWQGVILAMIPAAALMFRSPRIRYGAACVALAGMPVAFAVTFGVSMPGPVARGAVAGAIVGAGSGGAMATPAAAFDLAQSLRWFIPFWAAGVALFWFRTLLSWNAERRLRRNSRVEAPAEWVARLNALAVRLGVRVKVALFASELVDVPVVAGFLKPAIFVPAALFTGMPAEQLEYLLLHELAHVRRFDYAVNLLQKAVEGLLFYHPAVWWVSRILRTERENCCDDAVVATQGSAREYAAILAALEGGRTALAAAANGGHLKNRVLRLLNRPEPFSAAPALGLVAMALTATVAWAALQPQAVPPATPYEKWATEDVAYIITKAERDAFRALTSDPEREHFIEQFWERRDPTPGTAKNEFREEHYRRIGFVNRNFADPTLPGWKTDRGRIYITYGPPDEIDAHPAEYWQSWRYRLIEGVGTNVIVEFRDTNHDGHYRMTSDPHP